MAEVVFDHVEKVYDNGVRAVQELSLEIHDGEFLVLVGPSGCGKTTALRMVAGLEEISDGELSIGGRVVNDLTPKERDVAMVFQNYALYPHLTVWENIAFGLRLRRERKTVIDERVTWAAKMLEQMRADIAHLQRELGTTTIYVTHDQVEAMTMGDRVAVMSQGVLQQVDTPQRLYDHPANLFVAGFIGTPPMNLLAATVHADNGRVELGLGAH